MKPRYLLLLILLVFACSNRNTPRAVSEDFIYNYYQRADQAAALLLSHGLAVQKLEDEIARVSEVREPGQQFDEVPNMTYKPIGKEEAEAHVLFNYQLTISVEREPIIGPHLSLEFSRCGLAGRFRFSASFRGYGACRGAVIAGAAADG